jgi:Holliday junction resolvasome RuvABC DNA-binding subunit
MKLIITCLLTLGLASFSIAAETPAKKKSSAKAKAEATSDAPSGKALAAAKSLTPSQRTKLLDLLNQGDDKALQSLPGIGETRAAAIKKARPIKDPVDLVKVEGIGDETLADIVAHAKAGFPGADKEAPAKPKETAKKKAPAKTKSSSKKKTSEEPEEGTPKKK